MVKAERVTLALMGEEKMYKRWIVATFMLFLAAQFVRADRQAQEERLREAAKTMEEILKIPDGIPSELLDKAECVVILPSVKKVAIGFGGSYGRGAMTCRSGNDFSGPWGAPTMMALEGGSVGFQLGATATDFVFLIMNPDGAEGILRSKVKLGADASAAAGPKGRTSEAATDATMSAEILSYSRSKGLFAGVSLKGSTLRPDREGNEDLYAKKIAARAIVLEGAVPVPAAARGLVTALNRASPKNKSN